MVLSHTLPPPRPLAVTERNACKEEHARACKTDVLPPPATPPTPCGFSTEAAAGDARATPPKPPQHSQATPPSELLHMRWLSPSPALPCHPPLHACDSLWGGWPGHPGAGVELVDPAVLLLAPEAAAVQPGLGQPCALIDHAVRRHASGGGQWGGALRMGCPGGHPQHAASQREHERGLQGGSATETCGRKASPAGLKGGAPASDIWQATPAGVRWVCRSAWSALEQVVPRGSHPAAQNRSLLRKKLRNTSAHPVQAHALEV